MPRDLSVLGWKLRQDEPAMVCGRISGVANMLDKNYWHSGTVERGAGTIREPAEPASPPGENPVCCVQPMNLRLVHSHDRVGQKVFVAVWQCQICGRVATGTS
jgi:hypothetical protein